MGLLDDAIREHLELKRRAGADPGEVARDEHEALAPVFADESAALDDGVGSPGGEAPPAALSEPGFEAQPGADEWGPTADAAGLPDGVQETAELDMQSVLYDQAEAPAAAPAGDTATAPVRASQTPTPPWQDSPEWEPPPAPGSASDGALPPEIPGQEPLSFE